jgi:hypothetical protein
VSTNRILFYPLHALHTHQKQSTHLKDFSNRMIHQSKIVTTWQLKRVCKPCYNKGSNSVIQTT